jgi:site-specific DNA-methyltransferase (adenine-specific)
VATGGFNMSDADARPSGGRWPANVILDESQAGVLDEQSGTLTSGAWDGKRNAPKFGHGGVYNDLQGEAEAGKTGDSGGASRFFYVAKADQSERVKVDGIAHPTVKPLDLMRWLVRLVTPPGGIVLEPFAGSGTTVEACLLEGFRCVAIEREADYLPLIVQRINRRRDPVQAVKASGDDGGLFDLLGEASA